MAAPVQEIMDGSLYVCICNLSYSSKRKRSTYVQCGVVVFCWKLPVESWFNVATSLKSVTVSASRRKIDDLQ
jgi:hypothetical protein